jgi:hypothetical protein
LDTTTQSYLPILSGLDTIGYENITYLGGVEVDRDTIDIPNITEQGNFRISNDTLYHNNSIDGIEQFVKLPTLDTTTQSYLPILNGLDTIGYENIMYLGGVEVDRDTITLPLHKNQVQSNDTQAVPYTGVELPTTPGVNIGDTNSTQFSDGTVVNYTWDGTTWVVKFVEGVAPTATLTTVVGGTGLPNTATFDNGIDPPTTFDYIEGARNNLQLGSPIVERGNINAGGSQPADFTRDIYNWLGSSYKDHWQSTGDAELLSIKASQTVNAANTTNTGSGAVNIGTSGVNGQYKLNLHGALWVDNGRSSQIIGNAAGYNSSAISSIMIGDGTAANYSGNNSVLLGHLTGYNQSGDDNISVGNEAAFQYLGDRNISLGRQASANSTGSDNFTAGYLTGYSSVGNNNVFIGSNQNSRFNVGSNCISIGLLTGANNISNSSVMIGQYAGSSNTGSELVAIGLSSGQANTGPGVAAIGSYAGQFNTGLLGTFIGHSSGLNNKGDYTSAFGYGAGTDIALGANYNTTFGAYSGQNYDGSRNASFGYFSGRHVANNLTLLSLFGAGSGFNCSGNNSTLIGGFVGGNNTGDHVIAVGSGTQADGDGRVTARNNTGDFAIAVGAGALENNESNYVIGIGTSAGDVGFTNISEGSIAIGHFASRQFAGASPLSSTYRVGIGHQAMDEYGGGDYSIGIGYNSLKLNNANNVAAIGTNSGVGNTQANRFIISNSELPNFADRATALGAITVGLGAVAGNTYLYYNDATGAIEGVRL